MNDSALVGEYVLTSTPSLESYISDMNYLVSRLEDSNRVLYSSVTNYYGPRPVSEASDKKDNSPQGVEDKLKLLCERLAMSIEMAEMHSSTISKII